MENVIIPEIFEFYPTSSSSPSSSLWLAFEEQICSSDSSFWIWLALAHLVQFCEQSHGYSCWSLGLAWAAPVEKSRHSCIFSSVRKTAYSGETQVLILALVHLWPVKAELIHSIPTENRVAAEITSAAPAKATQFPITFTWFNLESGCSYLSRTRFHSMVLSFAMLTLKQG